MPENRPQNGPLEPDASTLIKIGSLARHGEEIVRKIRTDDHGPHEVDLAAVEGLLSDPEVQEWMAAMDAKALLPVMR
jgi:hypothetical protein